jgi:hypothetical protein
MLMDHPEQNCASCIFWKRMGPRLSNAMRDPSAAADTGTCQAHAPIVVEGNSAFPVSMFPTTHESRFCGDWEGQAHPGPDGDGGERVVPFPTASARVAA